MIFVNSMSDLFHKAIPTSFIDRIFDTMEAANWHTYQVLTKRSPRLRDYMNGRYADRSPPAHIWVGVSVEDQKGAARVAHLRAAKSAVRFLSVEPLIGSVGPIDLKDIHWVIAGGESGPNARVMRIEWAREIRDACREQRVPFFFKQWGGFRPKSGGRELDGREWSEWPRLTRAAG
jgi:protein gp37